MDNNSLDQQAKEILTRYAAADLYREQYTGTTTDRPVFNQVLEKLKENDTLVVTKLDRLARNTVEGIQIVQGLFDKGVSVHVLNVGLLENSSMGKFFLTTLLAVAEMERNIIIERTQSGKAMARARGELREGRPRKYNSKKVDKALDFIEEGNSYKNAAETFGISKTTLIRRMQEREGKIMEAKDYISEGHTLKEASIKFELDIEVLTRKLEENGIK